MRQIIFIIFLLKIYHYSKQDVLQFKETQILEIEEEVKKHDFLFVLFFEKQDGLTEDVHRQFLKAQQMLKKNDNIEIEVLALHKKLSLRLEKIFKVYEIPKVKFFRKNFKPQTYDGAIKPNAIRQWVKKTLRQKPYESIEIYELQGFIDAFQDDKENTFSIYFDQYDTKQFQLYEKFAMSKEIICYRSQEKFIQSILDFMYEKQSFFDIRKFKEIVKMNKKDIQKEIFEGMNVVEKISPDLYFVKFVKFQKQIYIKVLKVQNFDRKMLKEHTEQIKIEYFQPNGLYYIENIQKIKSGNLTYAFTFNTENLEKAINLRMQTIHNLDIDILMIDQQDQINNSIIQNLLYNTEESFYILEVDQKLNLRLYKQNIDYQNLEESKQNINIFFEKHKNNMLKEYMKSKCPEQDVYIGKFKETCSEHIYKLIEANTNPKLVLFFDNQKSRNELLLDFIQKYYENLKETELYALNVNENKTDLAVNKTFPYIKLFLDGNTEKGRGIGFTYNQLNYDNFFKKSFKEEEL